MESLLCVNPTSKSLETEALPLRSVVVFQYGSRFVSRQTADLHQLSGKHFLHGLTLEKHPKSKLGKRRTMTTTQLGSLPCF